MHASIRHFHLSSRRVKGVYPKFCKDTGNPPKTKMLTLKVMAASPPGTQHSRNTPSPDGNLLTKATVWDTNYV